MRRLLAVLVLVVGGVVARGALAQDVLPAAFYGEFAGMGLSETMADGRAVQVKPRDFDVTIARAENGFSVSWKTTEYTIRPGRSRLDSADETVVFVRSQRPGMFAEKNPGNLANGEPVYWARVSGSTLDVYRLAVNDEGRHETAVWQRVIDGDRMELVFQRSGETTSPRVVKGSLSRVKP